MAQIKSVVRVDAKVLVFDENAEQIPEYQGPAECCIRVYHSSK